MCFAQVYHCQFPAGLTNLTGKKTVNKETYSLTKDSMSISWNNLTRFKRIPHIFFYRVIRWIFTNFITEFDNPTNDFLICKPN